MKNIPVGQRVYLLRQGAGPRGIVASGHTTTAPYEDDHYSNPGDTTNYVDVEWDALVLDPADPLPTELLLELVPAVAWNNLQQSGTTVHDERAVATIEELWDDRLGVPRRPAPGRGQGRLSDAELRKVVEDHAQRLLTEHFERDGWTVVDTRVGNPYDAVATRGEQVAYLEAKGTVGPGTSVLVTAGEVEWARAHRGACYIGVVRNIEISGGTVVAGSGHLTVRPWSPSDRELKPTQYVWTTGM